MNPKEAHSKQTTYTTKLIFLKYSSSPIKLAFLFEELITKYNTKYLAKIESIINPNMQNLTKRMTNISPKILIKKRNKT